MLGPWPNRGIDHSTATCVWRESDPWFIIHMHNIIYIYITDYNRIIPHRSGDVPHITGGITHLLSGMRPKLLRMMPAYDWLPPVTRTYGEIHSLKASLGAWPLQATAASWSLLADAFRFFWPCYLWTVKSLTAGSWKTTEPNAPPENSPLCRMSSR